MDPDLGTPLVSGVPWPSRPRGLTTPQTIHWFWDHLIFEGAYGRKPSSSSSDKSVQPSGVFPVIGHFLLFKRPMAIGIFIPLVIALIFLLVHFSIYHTWIDIRSNWKLVLGIFFSSIAAGGSAEGGAVIAIPVLFYTYSMNLEDAHSFTLLVQALSMSSAAFAIVYSRIRIVKYAVIWCSLGGAIGVCLGLSFVTPHLTEEYAKMFFASCWLGFCIILFLVNTRRQQVSIDFDVVTRKKAVALFIFGFVGSIVTAIDGTGINLICFALLRIAYHISEKTATPTCVIIMATNAVIGTVYKQLFVSKFDEEQVNLFYVCVPFVLVAAPLGSVIAALLRRQVIAFFLYLSLITQFVTSELMIKQDVLLVLFTVAVLTAAIFFFSALALFTHRTMKRSSIEVSDTDSLNSQLTSVHSNSTNASFLDDGSRLGMSIVEPTPPMTPLCRSI